MALSAAARRVQEALQALGLAAEVVELARSTRTAQEAAEAIGTTVAQIVKSLVFVAGEEPVLVEASGVNRVDLEKVARLVGSPVRKANAEEVRRFTGYAIGGVPPCGHVRRLPVLIDEDLMRFEALWAAAGTPHAVFRTTPAALVRMTGGRIADVKQE